MYEGIFLGAEQDVGRCKGGGLCAEIIGFGGGAGSIGE